MDNNESAVHPSELLEFATVSPLSKHTGTFSSHVEYAAISVPPETADTLRSKDVDEKQQQAQCAQESLVADLALPRINSDALAAAQSEHKMTFRQGLRQYPRAIFWSAVISLAIVGEGFDTALINSFYAFPEFQKSYGVPTSDGGYQIATKWQSALNNGSVAGSVIGLIANGWLTERFGYRRTLLGALAFLAGSIFLTFFAFNIQTLLAGQILCGLPWGVCSTLTMSYAAEVMPLALRGYLTANVNLCWLWGQIIALGTLRGLLDVQSPWSYRVPFGVQWAWIVIVGLGAFFAPESPWWLVRQGKLVDAKRSLLRLSNKSNDFNPDNTIAMMTHTNEVEIQLNGRGMRNDLSYLECFKGTNARRTEIACMVFIAQNLSGLPVIAFAAYVYRQVGFNYTQAFDLTLGMHGLAICASIGSLALIRYFGRRQLYLIGLGLAAIVLLAGGVLGSFPENDKILWAIATTIIIFIFIFDATMGPLTYIIVAEIPSTRLRVNTVVLARCSYNICALVTNVLQQNMLNPLSWNWGAKSFYFWSAAACFCLIYCYFRLPETKGLTYHELDILFEKRAGARKFAGFQKKLAESGYFGLYYEPEERNDSVAWHK